MTWLKILSSLVVVLAYSSGLLYAGFDYGRARTSSEFLEAKVKDAGKQADAEGRLRAQLRTAKATRQKELDAANAKARAAARDLQKKEHEHANEFRSLQNEYLALKAAGDTSRCELTPRMRCVWDRSNRVSCRPGGLGGTSEAPADSYREQPPRAVPGERDTALWRPGVEPYSEHGPLVALRRQAQ